MVKVSITRLPHIVAILAATALMVYGIWFSFGRHEKTNSARFDLGNMEQTVWNVVHGHGFVLTDPYGTATVSRFAFHADPLLIVFTPFYAVWQRPEMLLFLQVLALVSGVMAVWLLARALRLSPWWAAIFAVIYSIHPYLHWALASDVHAVTFVIPLVLWAAWATLTNRRMVTLGCVLLAMLAKEQVGFAMMAFGIYTFWRQHDRRWGSFLIALPMTWALVMVLLVVPHYRDTIQSSSEVYRTALGTSAGEILHTTFSHPQQAVRVLVTRGNAVVAGQTFLSSGVVGIISPWWIAAVPDMVINGLSLKPAQQLMLAHYSSATIPWILLSSMVATSWIIARLERRRFGIFSIIVLMGCMLGSSLWSSWWIGPLPFARHNQSRFVTWSNPYAEPIHEWSKRIPAEAAVSVTNNVGSYFARRQYLYSFPLGVTEAQYIVVLEHHASPVVASDADVSARIAELRNDSTWEPLYRQDDLTILRRRE